MVHLRRRYRTISVLMAGASASANGPRLARGGGGPGCGVARRVSRRVVLRALTSPLDNGGRRPPQPVVVPRADLVSVSRRPSYELVLFPVPHYPASADPNVKLCYYTMVTVFIFESWKNQ